MTMTNTSGITDQERKDIKTLAIAYSAFNEAVANENKRSRQVWARMLLGAQAAVGIELVDVATLESQASPL